MNKDKTTHWGEVAQWYDDLAGQDGSEYHREVIFPVITRLIKSHSNSISNTKVLDLGCGQGAFCRYLDEKGAQVVGIDYSSKMIDFALARNNGSRIKYFVDDATKLLNEKKELVSYLQNDSFDVITIILAIQNIAYLSPVWQAAHKLLKTNGRIIIVMMHPSFRIPQHSDWLWNDKQKRQQRVMWSYLSSKNIEITTNPGRKASGFDTSSTIHFHRPLQAYINTLGNNNLWIDHIEELVSHKKEQVGIKSEALDEARNEFPLFILIQARKVI